MHAISQMLLSFYLIQLENNRMGVTGYNNNSNTFHLHYDGL